jgi:hypothetical protein
MSTMANSNGISIQPTIRALGQLLSSSQKVVSYTKHLVYKYLLWIACFEATYFALFT